MSISENVRDVAVKLTDTLPPAFIALLCVNLIFIFGLLWFVHDAQITRIQAVTEIFKACTTALSGTK